MGLGNWIQTKREGFKEGIVQKIVDKAIASLDSWGLKKWPVGWIRVRRMGIGWKTILGTILAFAPEITSFSQQYVPSIVYAFGLDDTQVQVVLAGIGKGLFLIGVADKYLKFTRPIERRTGERTVQTDSGAVQVVAPMSNEPSSVASLPTGLVLSTEEKVVYDTAFAAEVAKGTTLEGARAVAHTAVSKVRGTPTP